MENGLNYAAFQRCFCQKQKIFIAAVAASDIADVLFQFDFQQAAFLNHGAGLTAMCNGGSPLDIAESE